MDNYLLLILILIPTIGTLALLAIPGTKHTAIRVVATATGVVALVFSIITFVSYDRGAGGYQFVNQWQWIKGLGVSLHLGVDGTSTPMILLTGIMAFAGAIISWNIKRRPKDFYVLFYLLVAGVYGTFVALDLFFLFFFYELAVLPMYLLIGVWGSSTDFKTFIRTKEYGALKLTLFLVAGSVLVWIGLLAVYAKANIGSFDILALQNVQFARDFQNIFYPFFMIGFGVLAGLWPFHTWSPDGHMAAPTAVSMLHAGVLMKLGAYGIIRVGMTILPQGAHDWAIPLIALATVNVVYGAFSALSQRDLKYIIGYSSVSHMGYVLMGLATFNQTAINGAVLQMFSHGIMTGLFFALVGVVYDRAHIRDISLFGGLVKRMGTTTAFFTIAGLTSLGLPGLSGFVAELLVFIGTFQTYPLVAILGIIGAAVTAVYILRLLAKMFFGPLDPRWDKLPDAGRHEVFAMSCLAIVLVLVGVWPAPFMSVINSGVSTFVSQVIGKI